MSAKGSERNIPQRRKEKDTERPVAAYATNNAVRKWDPKVKKQRCSLKLRIKVEGQLSEKKELRIGWRKGGKAKW